VVGVCSVGYRRGGGGGGGGREVVVVVVRWWWWLVLDVVDQDEVVKWMKLNTPARGVSDM